MCEAAGKARSLVTRTMCVTVVLLGSSASTPLANSALSSAQAMQTARQEQLWFLS